VRASSTVPSDLEAERGEIGNTPSKSTKVPMLEARGLTRRGLFGLRR
jgi:hypothetical protein